MNKQNFIYQLLACAAVVPFLLGTYCTWCGPIEKIIHGGQIFTLYSIAVLSFLIGSWWSYSVSQNQNWKNALLAVFVVYAHVIGITWYGGYLPLTIIALGIGYVALWLQGFFMPIDNQSSAYPRMKTLLVLTIFVCHLLVAMQIYTL